MNVRFVNSLMVVLLTVLATVLTAGPAVAGPADDENANTEDVLFMVDGRELHGRIVEETRDAVVFHLVDRDSGLEATVTYTREEIARIERDVPLPDDAVEQTTDEPRTTAKPDEREEQTSYGAARADAAAEDAFSIYVVPMKGQVGTDIVADVYKEIVEDIRARDPDVIVFRMNCSDIEDTYLATLTGIDLTEIGLLDFDDSMDLVNMFRDGEMRKYDQVMWVEDSVGMSSTLAMAWDQLYMTSTAQLGGLQMVLALTGAATHSDEDKRAKMIAAWVGHAKTFLIYGGYADELALAMIMPEEKLSATWKGRNVKWSLDVEGEYVVDSSDQYTVNFTARDAENLCICDGIADNLDDLALLLGYREYRLVDGAAEEIVDGYVQDWRRALENCKDWWDEYTKQMGWGNPVQAKHAVERILASIRRYKAVETRLAMELGLTEFGLETIIEQLEIQIRNMRQGQGRGGGGGRSGGGGGGSGRRGPGSGG
jgi:uncharacterized membrane protein YgcG